MFNADQDTISGFFKRSLNNMIFFMFNINRTKILQTVRRNENAWCDCMPLLGNFKFELSILSLAVTLCIFKTVTISTIHTR